jgi:hypothetical protein
MGILDQSVLNGHFFYLYTLIHLLPSELAWSITFSYCLAVLICSLKIHRTTCIMILLIQCGITGIPVDCDRPRAGIVGDCECHTTAGQTLPVK